MEKVKKYADLAKFNADLFSKDPNTKVGAILLSSDWTTVLATGINGFPRKVEDLEERWKRPTKYDYVIHAEINAICNAARAGTAINGCNAVVTLYPCKDCAKALIQAGVRSVYAPKPDMADPRWGADFALSKKMFAEAGVTVVSLDGDGVTGDGHTYFGK